MLQQLPRPMIFAHRGSSAHAPENTLAAFELAVRQGADGVELDAKLTADGQVIVIHDATVDRTTNGHGRVGDLSLADIRRLDAGSHFDIAFRGEKTPTLEEVFQAVGQRTVINVELTNYTSPFDDLPVKVAGLVHRYHLEQQVLFSSFNPIALKRAHPLAPEVPLGLLAEPKLAGALARGWPGRWMVPYQCLHPAIRDVTPRLVENAHRRKQCVNVWTVNQARDMQRLFALGVDGIFTDDPVLALQVRQAFLKPVEAS